MRLVFGLIGSSHSTGCRPCSQLLTNHLLQPTATSFSQVQSQVSPPPFSLSQGKAGGLDAKPTTEYGVQASGEKTTSKNSHHESSSV